MGNEENPTSFDQGEEAVAFGLDDADTPICVLRMDLIRFLVRVVS